MVIARAEMHISPQRAALTAHHHADLGMRLQFDEAIHHLNARPLQIARPFDVGGLVETGLQFHESRNRLASFRRADQRLDDGRILRCAIERLLDRNHTGVGGGLTQELHHHIEAFVRMMNDDVLGTDSGKAIAAMIADAFREAGVVGRELQIAPLIQNKLGQIGKAQHILKL